MKVFSKSPAPEGVVIPNNVSVRPVAPAQDALVELGDSILAAGGATTTNHSLVMSATETIAARANSMLASPQFAFSHVANLPIVVNNFPSSFLPWSPEDQYQMSKWNYYASGVFQVYATPTGTFKWGDGVFDLTGFPSEATMQSQYNTSWYCGSGCLVLGVTMVRTIFGTIVEADLSLNPDASWTLDDEWVFDGGSVFSFRQTMIHELGHM
jgi:hypothetical protein